MANDYVNVKETNVEKKSDGSTHTFYGETKNPDTGKVEGPHGHIVQDKEGTIVYVRSPEQTKPDAIHDDWNLNKKKS